MNWKNLEKRKYEILLALFLISMVSSLILSFNLLKPIPLICDVTEGCFIVQNSEYSKTLGIENAYLGLVFFVSLSLLTFLQIKNPKKEQKILINFGAVIGGVWSFYSLYLMGYVIQAYCRYCTVLDISSIIALFVVILFWKK
tara:strand:+ start:706 stop:1131 length:426 start_codon:yes stop_codon:yes gene_type:complete